MFTFKKWLQIYIFLFLATQLSACVSPTSTNEPLIEEVRKVQEASSVSSEETDLELLEDPNEGSAEEEPEASAYSCVVEVDGEIEVLTEVISEEECVRKKGSWEIGYYTRFDAQRYGKLL